MEIKDKREVHGKPPRACYRALGRFTERLHGSRSAHGNLERRRRNAAFRGCNGLKENRFSSLKAAFLKVGSWREAVKANVLNRRDPGLEKRIKTPP